MNAFESGSLNFRSAVRVWCAATEVNGAFFPDEFRGVCNTVAPLDDTVVTFKDVELWVDEAIRRANWCADQLSGGRGNYVPPREPELIDGGLEWRTSTVCHLAPCAGGWEVWITEPHPDRVAAAQSALAKEIGPELDRLRAEAESEAPEEFQL